MSCPSCTSPDLVTIHLAVEGPVRFSHCRNCEHRWWTEGSEARELRLPDVLQRVGSR